MLMLLATTVLFELALYIVGPLWRVRKYLASLISACLGFFTGGLIAESSGLLQITVLVLSAARVFNLLRIIEGRMHESYLRRVTLRTGVIFGLAQLLLLGIICLGYQVDYSAWLMPVALLQLGTAILLLIVTSRNIIKTSPKPHTQHYSDKELPTVSLLIPARNETYDLEGCLRSALASDYPKLEIIVLDDCSHDKTSEIIKGFAQDGVRFIRGAQPSERWLAKNQAYERLQEEASGELLLFAGVDVRFGPHSIRALVTTLLNRKKQMVSVMPKRLNSTIFASFIQPMRYWWEFAFPRRIFNRPPVLSTCWLITANALKAHGTFAAVSRAIIPEMYFARELVRDKDGYSFVRSDDVLDIQTVKSIQEQRETAIRVRYPQIRRRPENALALLLAEVIFLLGPFIAAALTALGYIDLPIWVTTAACLLLVATHLIIVSVSNPSNVPIALFNLPAVVVTEIVLGLTSMLKYEFSVVDWKGRNICIPVMHTVPRLPRMDDKK
jgi:glycosyltransferase involved in cell wall biosynthesis